MSFATSFPPFIGRVAVNLPSWRDCCARGFFLGSAKGEPLIQETTYRTCLPESLQLRRLVPVADPGEGPRGGAQGGRPLPQPLFFRAKWSPKGREKKFFWEPLPLPYLRVWMTGSPLSWRSGCTTDFAVIQWVVSFAAVIRVVTRHATLLPTSVAWRVTTLITAAKETIQWGDWVYKGSFPRWKSTTAQVLFRILHCHWSWKHCSHI